MTTPLLLSRSEEALKKWPFITGIEEEYGLPAHMLLAVGFRETGLRNISGDSGHGWGVWQRDNRSWNVGPSYLLSVRKQAEDAASLLVANKKSLGTWGGALAAYNAGCGSVRRARANGLKDDTYTTSHNYGQAILGYISELNAHYHTATPHAHTVVIVKAGDTLGGFAKKYKTTVKAIAQLNKLPNANVIHVGQHITIP